MKEIKLRADNLSDENYKLYGVTTNKQEVERACKYLFGWRTSTKRYDSIYERYISQGSLKYDKVIKYLSDKQERQTS